MIPIYHSFGIDDVGSCVDFLLEEKHWENRAGNIHAKELDFAGKRDKLIRHIQKKGLETDVANIVADVWNDIEDACKINRKKRYE